MSDLWFNVRFGTYHWQWGPNGMTWQRNPAQVHWRDNNPLTWKWFAAYVLFGRHL